MNLLSTACFSHVHIVFLYFTQENKGSFCSFKAVRKSYFSCVKVTLMISWGISFLNRLTATKRKLQPIDYVPNMNSNVN